MQARRTPQPAVGRQRQSSQPIPPGLPGLLKFMALPLFLSLFLVFLETAFILGLFGQLEWRGYLACLFFSISAAQLPALLASFFRPRLNKAVVIISCSLVTAFFIAQLIYYTLMASFFSFYSMSTGGIQVMQFWHEILNVILNRWPMIIVFLLPLLILLFFGSRRLDFYRSSWKQKSWLAGLMLATFIGGLAAVRIPSDDLYSPRRLYDQVFSPSLSACEFGLLTTMRLDLRRELVGTAVPQPPTTTGTTTTTAEPAPVYAANQLAIDFAALIKSETDPAVQAMHRYFQSVTPTLQNEHTGQFKGKNLILLVAESFTPLVISKELTPALYRISREGFQFSRFYTPIWPVSTSDGEYTTNLSLIPSDGNWSMTASAKNSLPLAIGRLLLAQGYQTQAYHNHTYTFYKRNLSHPNLGYEIFKGVDSGLQVTRQWPESDLEMIGATVGEYLDRAPFATYYMTVSGHLEYNKYNAMAKKNWSAVAGLAYSAPVKAYLACNIELDRALQRLVSELEAAGQAENTVIALCSDHYPYGLSIKEMSELKGQPIEKNFELYENAFYIWHQGIQPAVCDTPGSNLDVLPTLANLFGLPYDSRLLMGRDLFADTNNVVIFANRSWLNRQGRYNTLTRTFQPAEGQSGLDKAELARISRQIDEKFTWSGLVLDKDYYARLNLAAR